MIICPILGHIPNREVSLNPAASFTNHFALRKRSTAMSKNQETRVESSRLNRPASANRWIVSRQRRAETILKSSNDKEKRRYQPTATRMTSGSNCLHLNCLATLPNLAHSNELEGEAQTETRGEKVILRSVHNIIANVRKQSYVRGKAIFKT